MVSFLKRLFGRKANIDQLEGSGKQLLAYGDYEEAARLFEQAAEASTNQKQETRAIEDFMAAGRIYRNVDPRKAAKCFLRAAHMQAQAGSENYQEAFKCYESAYRLLEKIKRDREVREAEITLGWMILTQMAAGKVESALNLAQSKILSSKNVPRIVKTVIQLARGRSVKIPESSTFKEHPPLIETAIRTARAFSALRAQLDTRIDETVVVGENIDVVIHFQSRNRVTVTALNLYVTNHAKVISKIEPEPPFAVDGKNDVKITLALTLAGSLTVGPLSFDFESAGYQFTSKTTKPININVLPAEAHVELDFEQHQNYLQEGYVFAEATLALSNASRGVVETIELELQPPPEVELVGTASTKTINMLSPGRSVSFPILLKSKLTTPQTITIALKIDHAPSRSETIQVNFEPPEPEVETEEDTDWLKDLEAS